MDTMDSTPPVSEQTLLVAIQHPERDLMTLGQAFNAHGLTPISDDSNIGGQDRPPSWLFRSLDGSAQAHLKLFMELGVYRLVLRGVDLQAMLQMLSRSVPLFTPPMLAQRVSTAQSEEEQQTLITLLVLCFNSANEAVTQLSSLFDQGSASTIIGLINGLTLLETVQAAEHLQQIAARFEGTPIGDAASEGFDRLVELGVIKPPLDPEVVLAEVQALLSARDAEKAAVALEQLDELEDLEDLRVPLYRGQAFYLLGRLEDAIEILTLIVDDSAVHLDASISLARCYERLGDLERALSAVSDVLELAPDDDDAQKLHARLLLILKGTDGSPQERLAQLDDAVTANPADADLLIQRAATLIDLERHDDALADLANAQALGGRDARIEVYQFEAHLGRGAYLSALRGVLKDLSTLPAQYHRRAELQRGRAYLALGEPERAAASFADVYRRSSLNEALLGRGLALEQAGQGERADELYQRALEGHDHASLLAELKPIVYAPCPRWVAAGAEPLSVADAPAQQIGLDSIDPFFKYCLSCGATALRRRTSCKECGSKDFLK